MPPHLTYAPAMPSTHERDEARRREALQTLQGLERGTPTFAGSSLSHAARRAADHFAGKDAVGAGEAGATDPVELWGRRIGRGLSLIGVIGLAVYLYLTYLR